jgi:hypothetical protein
MVSDQGDRKKKTVVASLGPFCPWRARLAALIVFLNFVEKPSWRRWHWSFEFTLGSSQYSLIAQ